MAALTIVTIVFLGLLLAGSLFVSFEEETPIPFFVVGLPVILGIVTLSLHL